MRMTSPSAPTTGRALSVQPEVMAVGGAQAEILVDAAAALLEHGVEAGAVAVALEGMQRRRASPRPALRARRARRRAAGLDLGADIDAVGRHVPVEDHVAAAGERQRLAFDVATSAPGAKAPPAKAFCMIVKPISMTISTRPPISAGATRSLVSVPGDGQACRRHPGQQQEPGRDQHHRAVVAVRREIEDEDASRRRRWWRARCGRRRRRPARR